MGMFSLILKFKIRRGEGEFWRTSEHNRPKQYRRYPEVEQYMTCDKLHKEEIGKVIQFPRHAKDAGSDGIAAELLYNLCSSDLKNAK